MSERTLFDARVRAWLVKEGDETACYIGLSFHGAPQVTVRAAARPLAPGLKQVIAGADATPDVVDSGEEYFFRYVAKGNPSDAAANDRWWLALSSDSREYYRYAFKAIKKYAPAGLSDAAQYKWWQSLGKDRREELREKAGQKSGLEKAVNAVHDVAKVALPVASLILPALAPLAIAANISTAVDVGTKIVALTKTGKQVVDLASKAKLADAAKHAAVTGAAGLLKRPEVAAELAKKGVPMSSLTKTAQALEGVARSLSSSSAQKAGKLALSRVNAVQAEQLFRKANPKLSSAAVKKQVGNFLYLAVG